MTAASSTVRVHADTHDKLRDFAAGDGRSIPEVLRELVEREERERALRADAEAMGRIRHDSEAWAEWEADTKAWEALPTDGLENDPWPVDEHGEPAR